MSARGKEDLKVLREVCRFYGREKKNIAARPELINKSNGESK